MYKSLLLSAGGGIISRDQQAEQRQRKVATIAIGLGGTGIDCLKALKREVYDRLKPDDDGPIQQYKHIKFLAIDTDACSVESNGMVYSINKETEFLNIGGLDIYALLRNATVLKSKPHLKWLKASSTQADGNGIGLITDMPLSAQGIRQLGRLLLFQNCNNFCAKFENVLKTAIADLPANAEINIHIFTGLCGGTGSGIFLDVCYLIQHILSQMALSDRARTYGYFFLPDTNISRIADSKIQECIKNNGFAAMKELDYCMNFDKNGGCWDEEYDGFNIHTTEPPVHLANLISATDATGNSINNGYDYAMHVAVDCVMDFIIKDVSELEDYRLYKHCENLSYKNRLLGDMVSKEHGASYSYCIHGASSAYLPYKEITTYLTSKIFEGFGKLDYQLPSENDIDLFVQNIGLKYEDITKTLGDKVPPIPLYAVDTKTIYEQTQGLSPDTIPQVLGQMRDTLAKVSGQLTENKKVMLADLEDANVDANKTIASMITRVKKKQIEIAAQPDKGPYYAGAILHSVTSKDLQYKIDGYIMQNNHLLSMARADMTLRDQSMADTLRNLQNSTFLNRKRRAKEYVQAVNSFFKQSAKIEFLSVMNDILVAFKKQVNDLYTQYYAIFENVMRNLEQTFAANLTALANPVENDTSYAVKLMTIKDMQESLDSSVKKMLIDDLIKGFVNYMLNNSSVWIGQEESKIAFAVSHYFLGVLTEYTNKTMIDYLKIKYNTEDPNMITNKVYNEIIYPLSQKAAPLFWVDGSKYQIASAGELGFCSVPWISPEIVAAANNYNKANNRVGVRPSCNYDRISFLISRCGVPLYGYQGVDTYRNATRVTGTHLHEGASGDDRDWRSLHDITPLSCMDESTLSETLKKKSETYDEAFEKGIVAHRALDDVGSFDFVINKVNDEAFESEINEINEAINSGDITIMTMTLEKYKDAPIAFEVDHTIRNVASMGYEDIVAKDLIVSSETYMKTITQQLENIETCNDLISALKKKCDSIKALID